MKFRETVRNLWNKSKGLVTKAAVAVCVGVPCLSRAEDAQDPFSAATTEITDLVDKIKAWVGSNATLITKIIIAGLIITLIFMAVRWIKKGMSRAG